MTELAAGAWVGQVVQEGGGSSLGATVGATVALMARNYLIDGNYPRGLRVESDSIVPNAALVKVKRFN